MDLKKRKEELAAEIVKGQEELEKLNKVQAQLNATRENLKANFNRIQGAIALINEMEEKKPEEPKKKKDK